MNYVEISNQVLRKIHLNFNSERFPADLARMLSFIGCYTLAGFGRLLTDIASIEHINVAMDAKEHCLKKLIG